MKKIIYIISLISIIYLSLAVKETKILENESIRFRIIANSNDINDQNIKYLIKKELENKFFPILDSAESIEEARTIVNNNKKLIDEIIKKYTIDYKIEYGNLYFPEKQYNDFVYKEGFYESLIISLGKSNGNNWWCVMYPPLCLIDSESNNYEDIEYKLYINEIMDN